MARPKNTTSQARIVKAGAELFLRRGYQNTTIDDIASRAGLAKPTVYQYVKSKSDILERIVQNIVDQCERATNEAINGVDDPIEQFDAIVRASIRIAVEPDNHFRVFYEETKDLPPAAAKRFAAWRSEFVGRFEALISECVDEGLMRDTPPPRMAALLISSMITSLATWYDISGPVDQDELADYMLALVDGYLTDDGRARMTAAAPADLR